MGNIHLVLHDLCVSLQWTIHTLGVEHSLLVHFSSVCILSILLSIWYSGICSTNLSVHSDTPGMAAAQAKASSGGILSSFQGREKYFNVRA